MKANIALCYIFGETQIASLTTVAASRTQSLVDWVAYRPNSSYFGKTCTGTDSFQTLVFLKVV